jgi:hypothetical protein
MIEARGPVTDSERGEATEERWGDPRNLGGSRRQEREGKKINKPGKSRS